MAKVMVKQTLDGPNPGRDGFSTIAHLLIMVDVLVECGVWEKPL